MSDEFIRRSDAMNKINDIAAEFLKDHSIQCDIAAGIAVGIKNDVIKTLPAADVVEVVHGYWIITEEILETIRECSCCHCKTYYPKPLSFNVRKSPYCEDCGAKMDGKGD